MTIIPYSGIAVFDVEENAYVFKESGDYHEGIDTRDVLNRIGAKKVLRAAAHTVKFLTELELKEMELLTKEVPHTKGRVAVHAI